MWDQNTARSEAYRKAGSAIFGLAALMATHGTSEAATAQDVMTKMSPDQRSSYITGVVDGLATARWLADRPDATGTNCIYDWYYRQPRDQVWPLITAWFERQPDQQAGILIQVLINRECGG